MSKHRLKPLDFQNGRVQLSHGSGGRATAQLIDELFALHFRNDALATAHDAAVLPQAAGRWAISTDSFVVSPLFFPGGCIGDLAVHGSVNDVAMAGAGPVALTAGFILEEGFPLSDLARIVVAMARAAKTVGIPIVCGDTKVVERGKADGVFINTTCVGIVPDGVQIDPKRACPGDVILVSGPIGEHGIAILSLREGLSFDSDVRSDTAPLAELVSKMLQTEPDLHVLRDPTRGGVAAALHEIAEQARVDLVLDENALPIGAAVRSAAEWLGLDPLHLACEGRLLAFCPPNSADAVLQTLHAHPLGTQAVQIGVVQSMQNNAPIVELKTRLSGSRLVRWPAGEPLPRIC